jgi:hypothetical protein
LIVEGGQGRVQQGELILEEGRFLEAATMVAGWNKNIINKLL